MCVLCVLSKYIYFNSRHVIKNNHI